MSDKQLLKKRIKQLELQIKKLDLHVSGTDVCNDLYNSLIMQKAILKKQLDEINQNQFIAKLKHLLPHKEKLICDYFK